MERLKRCPVCGLVQPDAIDCQSCGTSLLNVGFCGPAPATGQAALRPTMVEPRKPPAEPNPPAGLLLRSQTGKLIRLKSGDIIGRTSAGSEQLTEYPSVSRQHAKVIYQDGHWIIEDLDSVNGLYVNGRRIKRAVLELGGAFSLSQSCQLTVVSC
ncbi:MAG: FHA domain-containing protein [Deltaproteobacteria bacterium]|nr:FHA domain-containing protein [Deltaproteobacteria bacterium]